MPRAARKISTTGIYHIMLRGINQQLIFDDDEDRKKFLEILKDCKETSGFMLHAYCLMGDHAHLLIKIVHEGLEQIFKRIGAKYVHWFNWKHNRTGPLFQDRFKSEPVESTEYFFTVIRFIHQNPVKAQLAGSIEDYKWSSYKEYARKRALTDTAFALKMMRKDKFIEFNNETNSDICLEITPPRISDKAASEMIKVVLKCNTIKEIQQLEAQERKEGLIKLKQDGLSIRQISRLTGIGKGIVERA